MFLAWLNKKLQLTVLLIVLYFQTHYSNKHTFLHLIFFILYLFISCVLCCLMFCCLHSKSLFWSFWLSHMIFSCMKFAQLSQNFLVWKRGFKSLIFCNIHAQTINFRKRLHKEFNTLNTDQCGLIRFDWKLSSEYFWLILIRAQKNTFFQPSRGEIFPLFLSFGRSLVKWWNNQIKINSLILQSVSVMNLHDH